MAVRKDEKVEGKPVVVEDKAAEKAAGPVVEAQPDEPSAEAPAAAEEKAGEETTDEKPAKAEDANTVLVQAIRSFEGVEGDKGPRSEPFRVSHQRYVDLKANDLVKLVDEKAGSDPH